MPGELSFDLHVLTAHLDRSADRILRTEYGVSYRRFLTLLTVAELGAATQRAVAERLGITEPSSSRMTGILVESGLLDSVIDPAGGNRRRLTLTVSGEQTVHQCRELLETRFAELVERSGASYQSYARDTKLLLRALASAPDKGGSNDLVLRRPTRPVRQEFLPHGPEARPPPSPVAIRERQVKTRCGEKPP